MVPAWTWAQSSAQSIPDALNPHLNWVRSLRPALKPNASTAPQEVPPPVSDAQTSPEPADSSASKVIKDSETKKWAILLSDKTLYRTFRRWSQEAQYQLLWQIDRDYPIEAEVKFESTLREAVAQVMAGVALTDFPLQAIFNPSTRVLRVIRHLDADRR